MKTEKIRIDVAATSEWADVTLTLTPGALYSIAASLKGLGPGMKLTIQDGNSSLSFRRPVEAA